MVEEVKKNCWIIEARVMLVQKVVFEEDVTAEEAKQLYLEGDYYDIIIDDELVDVEKIWVKEK